MTTEQVWVVAAGAVALVALLCAGMAWRTARRATAQVTALSARLAEPAAEPVPAPDRPDADATPYVITGLEAGPGTSRGTAPVPHVEGRAFADTVTREAAVKAVSWGHGLRRALSPESRNRIRFQVRQQAKQQRRDRRAEVREALREYRARQRVDEGDAA